MQQLTSIESMFHGAVSLEVTDEYIKPWRIPFNKKELFVPNNINGTAEIPAGVRIAFRSNTSAIKIKIIPSGNPTEIDCVIDGRLQQAGTIKAQQTTFTFQSLSDKDKLVELYLSQKVPVKITDLWIEDNAAWSPASDSRLRWVAYGSSISQCVEAASPSQTWPTLAASQMELDLTCLGYNGNCHMEPMVARMIRDIPADFISLCIGINIMRAWSLSERTFASSLIGFIQIIREKHPDIPIIITSPIFNRGGESTENPVRLTLEKIRNEMVDIVKILENHGDRNLHYINGLDLFGEEDEKYLPDGLHPNAEGYRIIAKRFEKMIRGNIALNHTIFN